jgi:hypothetical protein
MKQDRVTVRFPGIYRAQRDTALVNEILAAVRSRPLPRVPTYS